MSSSSICFGVRTSGNFFSAFGNCSCRTGSSAQIFSFDQEPIKGAEGGELQANVRARLAVLHQLEKVIAEIVRAAFLPGANVFFGAKRRQRLPVNGERARGNVALDFERSEGTPRRVCRGSCGQATILLGLFDLEPSEGGPGAIAVLASKNWGGIRRDQLVSFQDELGVKAVAGRLVNRLAAEGAIKFVFVIVIAAETQFFTVRREFFLLVEHDQLRRAPGLSGLAARNPRI